MTSAGFPPEAFKFLTSLSQNNTKEWFEANKSHYQQAIKKPADHFRPELERALSTLTGHEIASKQFRINRDLRFSKDKTPYNTHIRMAFWPKGSAFEGRDAQPPSFFLSVEPSHIRFGTGCMAFSKPILGTYLHALEAGKGEEIEALLNTLISQGFERSAPDLAKAPRGFPKDHPHADLARHKGLAVWKTTNDIKMVIGEEAAGSLADAWRPALPFWSWLVALSSGV
ncbi:MAG: TIGR02453 family protein [Pseudomonadota bacterium]